MLKFRIILIPIGLLVLLGGLLYYARWPESSNVNPHISAFMRNVSWGTDLESFTPYKHNDELEYVFIAEPDTGNIARIDLNKLRQTVDITEVRINDRVKSMEELQAVPFDTMLKISVRWKAKTGNIENGDIENSIGLSFSEAPKTSMELTGAISGATPPIDTEFSRNTFSSNIDNLIVISGNNLESIDRVIVGEKSFSGSFREGKYYFAIPKNIFGNGEYFVGLYLRNGKLVSTKEKFTFTYDPHPLNVSAITPNVLRNDIDRFVVLQGNGFKKMISLQLSNNLIFQNTLFTVVNDHVVSVKIPKGLQAGDYYFNMMDSSGIYDAKNMKLRITP